MSGITNYGQSSSNAVSISSITAHSDSNGITVYNSITSDSGSAISVGEGLKAESETIAI